MKVITQEEKDVKLEDLKNLPSGSLVPITLTNGYEMWMKVARDDEGKVYLCAEDCLPDARKMNNEPTINGGYLMSDLREWLTTEFYKLVPDEVKEVILPTEIVRTINGKRKVETDYVFIASRTQLFGVGDWSTQEPSDSQFDIYLTEKSRVKERASVGTEWYWLSSSDSGNSGNFCHVSTNGNLSGNFAYNSYGVVPCFRIG